MSALEALKATLAPFLIAQEQARQAEAARLRKIAEDEAAAATAALRAADPADLGAKEAAEGQVKAAQRSLARRDTSRDGAPRWTWRGSAP